MSMLNSLAASDHRATSISANLSVGVEYLRPTSATRVIRAPPRAPRLSIARVCTTQAPLDITHFSDKSANTGSKLSQWPDHEARNSTTHTTFGSPLTTLLRRVANDSTFTSRSPLKRARGTVKNRTAATARASRQHERHRQCTAAAACNVQQAERWGTTH